MEKQNKNKNKLKQNKNKLKRWQLQQRQGLPLEVKIELTKLRIREFYEKNNGEIYLCFSGGKDSMVLYDLIRSVYPKDIYTEIKIVFVDTKNEYPEIKEFVNEKNKIESIICLKPKKSFVEVINKYGVPIISKKISMGIDRYNNTKSEEQKKLRLYGGINPTSGMKQYSTISKKYHYLVLDHKIKASERCCYFMKKEPILRFERKTKLNPMIGTLADESGERREKYLRSGCNNFKSKKNISTPLGFWTEQNILEYIYKNKLKIAECYGEVIEKNGKYHTTKEDRTGCMGCMFGIIQESKKGENRFQRMKKSYPKHYEFYINGLGFGKYLSLINVDY